MSSCGHYMMCKNGIVPYTPNIPYACVGGSRVPTGYLNPCVNVSNVPWINTGPEKWSQCANCGGGGWVYFCQQAQCGAGGYIYSGNNNPNA